MNGLGLKKIGAEKIINLHIQKLPEGFYLATSENIQGLVTQGRTISETLDIARDLASKLLEIQDAQIAKLESFDDHFEYPLVVGI